jgi:hypothetical protein
MKLNNGNTLLGLHKGRGWPSREQKLLLNASLLSGEEALKSWKRWTDLIDVNKIDQDSYRLLPLAVHNLKKEGIKDPFLKRFGGLKKKTWYKNQILFKTLKDILLLFHKNRIRTIVLKGAALIPLYFKDLSIRPQNDVDILIRPESVSLASRMLENSGWKIKGRPKKGLKEETLDVRSAVTFEKGTISSIDLHWHAVKECIYPEADYDFWKYARPMKINGIDTAVMSPTDQFYLTCIHASRHQVKWEPLPTVSWIADCIYILRGSHNEIDFNRMLAQAQKHNLVFPLWIALEYLNQEYIGTSPSVFMNQFRKTKISPFEYKEIRTRQMASPFIGPFILKWYVYRRSIRKEKNLNYVVKIWGFLKFLQRHYELPSVSLLPVSLLLKGAKKVRMWLLSND